MTEPIFGRRNQQKTNKILVLMIENKTFINVFKHFLQHYRLLSILGLSLNNIADMINTSYLTKVKKAN